MALFNFSPLKRAASATTATVARDRLQIILAREHAGNDSSGPDYLPALQQELLNVIAKYVQVSPGDIKVQLDRQNNLDILDVNIVLPENKRF